MRRALRTALACVSLIALPVGAQPANSIFQPFETLPGRGGEAMQMSITGGYGGWLAVITAWKRSGKSARLRYYNPENRRTLEGVLSAETWQGLQAAARYAIAHENDAPRELGEDANICMHAAGVGVTVIDKAGRNHEFGADYCNGGPAMGMAEAMMTAGFRQLPECRWVSADLVDHEIERLQACSLLKGNLQSAGEALTWLDQMKFPIVGSFHAHWALEGLLNERVVASWDKRAPMRGSDTIKAAIYEDFLGQDIAIDWVQGVSRQQVIIDAIVKMPPDEPAGKERLLRLALTVQRKAGGGFELVRIAQR